MKDNTSNNNLNRKSVWLKIVVIIAILVVILAIFLIKNNMGATNSEIGSQIQLQTDSSNKKYPLNLQKADLEAFKAYGVPTIIDFGADTCVPCKQMAPVLEKMNKEMGEKAAIQFVDVWKYTEGVDSFPISLIPTQVFINSDGTPYVPSEKISAEIEFTKYQSKSTEEHVFTIHQGALTEDQFKEILSEMGVE